MLIRLQLSSFHIACPTCFQIVTVGGHLQLMNVGTAVLAKAIVLAFGDGERAGAQADSLPCVKLLCVAELQYQSWQTAKRPWAEAHRDVNGEPRIKVAATPMACCFLALVAEDGLALIMQCPLLILYWLYVVSIISFHILWHPCVESVLAILRLDVGELVFAPIVMVTSIRTEYSGAATRIRIAVAEIISQRIVQLQKTTVMLADVFSST